MAGSRHRAVVGLVALTLAVLTGGVVVDRFVLQAEWWQVDQTTTAEGAPRLLDVGPPPGPVVESWRVDTPVGHSGLTPYDQVAHAVIDGELVVVNSQGLDVRDARSGASRWHYYRAGWVVLGWAATGHRLVAYLERAGHRGDRMLAGFDATRGRLLWRQQGEVPATTELSSLRWPAGSGVVLTTLPGDRRTLHGRSAATGELLWTGALPQGCALPEAGAYASDSGEDVGGTSAAAFAGGSAALAAFSLDCGGTGRVFALDPGTGRDAWSQELDVAYPPQVSVRGDAVEVSDGAALRLYDRTGRQFAVRPGEDVCGATMCPVALASGGGAEIMIVVYRARQGDSGRRMEAIDISSGQSRWQRDVPAYASLITSADRLYALRPSVAPGLLPAGIDVIAAGNGASTTVPAPLVLPAEQGRIRPWMAAGGGMLYVSVPEAGPQPAGGTRLIALRGAATGMGAASAAGPAELGNVPASEWPDACSLLSGADLPSRFHTRPGYAQIGDVRLPHPVTCTYELDPPGPSAAVTASPTASAPASAPASTPASAPASAPGRQPKGRSSGPSPHPSASAGPASPDKGQEQNAQAPTVTVEWVAGNAGAASGLLAALRDTQFQSRPVVAGDEAYELDPPGGTITERVDRYVVSVNAFQTPGLAIRLARSVVVALHARPHP